MNENGEVNFSKELLFLLFHLCLIILDHLSEMQPVLSLIKLINFREITRNFLATSKTTLSISINKIKLKADFL